MAVILPPKEDQSYIWWRICISAWKFLSSLLVAVCSIVTDTRQHLFPLQWMFRNKHWRTLSYNWWRFPLGTFMDPAVLASRHKQTIHPCLAQPLVLKTYKDVTRNKHFTAGWEKLWAGQHPPWWLGRTVFISQLQTTHLSKAQWLEVKEKPKGSRLDSWLVFFVFFWFSVAKCV